MPDSEQPSPLALRKVVFGNRVAEQLAIRDAVVGLADLPEPNTPDQDARKSYDLLRKLIAELGGSATALAADHLRLAEIFEWSAVAAPRLMPVLSGHFTLVLGAFQRLGDPKSAYQRECLQELESADAVGVFLLTELGFGTRVIDQQTTATWNADRRTFTLNTPAAAAIKFMPNVATPGVAKATIVTARLIADGRQEGIWPFVVRLRSDTGIAPGVHIAALPATGTAPMDHAAIGFQDIEIPEDAWLHGNLAHLDSGGGFNCDLDLRQRFTATIGQLQAGRICLAGAAVASARSALAFTVHYAQQRLTAGDVPMIDRDTVQRDLVSATASVYAMTALAHVVHKLFAEGADPAVTSMAAMLAKPLLSHSAHDIVETCRRRCGAQGLIRTNYLPDWLANIRGIITAEGEGQALQVAAGRALRRTGIPIHLVVADVPDRLPWWHQLLDNRAEALAAGGGKLDGMGPDSAAADLSTAIASRLAAAALVAAAHRCADATTRQTLWDLAAVYTLERIEAHAAWYTAHGELAPSTAAALYGELAVRRRLLASQLSTLTQAFSIPKLPAPIYSPDYVDAWLDHCDWSGRFAATDQDANSAEDAASP